jgi:hypothetical protein
MSLRVKSIRVFSIHPPNNIRVTITATIFGTKLKV